MALLKKRSKEPKTIEIEPIQKEKLKMFVTIVDFGNGNAVSNLLKKCEVAASFIFVGNGTANRQIMDILGIEDNRKDIVISLVKETAIPDIKKELEAFLLASKRNRGIGYSISLSSIIGNKVYQFLINEK